MGFFDTVGHAFDWLATKALPDANSFSPLGPAASGAGDLAADTAQKIGLAYTAADNNAAGHAIFNAIGFLAKPIVGAADAAAAGYSYGVARPISTAAQVDTRGTFAAYLSHDAWAQAWNRSADISPWQAIAIDSAEITGAQADGFNSKVDVNKLDPFAPDAAPLRRQLFVNDTKTKIATGTLDALTGQFLDPSIGLAKGVSKARRTLQVVKTDRQASILDQAVNGINPAVNGTVGNYQAKRAGQLVDKIDAAGAGQIRSLPEFSNSADAGALATAFQKAKDLNPGFSPEQIKGRRQAIANVLGASWGNQASQDALTLRQGMLAIELEKLSNITPQAQTANLDLVGKGKQLQLDLFSQSTNNEIELQKADIQRQIDNLYQINNAAGTSEARIVGTLPQKRAAGAYDKALDSTVPTKTGPGPVPVPEAWLKSAAGTPIRVVGNALGKRTPGSVHVKDTVTGYQDMLGILAKMRHTSSGTKQGLLDSFVTAPTIIARSNVVDSLRRTLVRDTGAKYGYDPDAVERIINSGEDRMLGINSMLKGRLYTASGDPEEGNWIRISDPEEDIHHVVNKPHMQTQLEDTVNVLDPAAVDKVFKAHAGLRFMDQFGLGDQASNVGQLANAIGGEFTNLWKTSALFRVAYPFRIQTDSQLRLMAHMGAMAYMSSLKVRSGARVRSLTSFAEKGQPLADVLGSRNIPRAKTPYKNLVDLGDEYKPLKKRHDVSLAATLGKDLGYDGAFDIRPEEFGTVCRTVLDGGGNIADLSTGLSDHLTRKVRSGNFGAVQPQDPNWLPSYVRALNRQISNDPLAVELLKDGNINRVAAEVRRQLKEGGPFAKEYREVGSQFSSIEEWLGRINENNNHLLPAQEMRNWILPRVPRAENNAKKLDVTSWDSIPIEIKQSLFNDNKDQYDKWVGKNIAGKTIDDPIVKAMHNAGYGNVKIGQRVTEATKKSKGGAKRDILLTHPKIAALPKEAPQLRPVAGGVPGKINADAVKRFFADPENPVKAMPVHGEGFNLQNQGHISGSFKKVQEKFFSFAAEMPELTAARAPLFMHSYEGHVKDALGRLEGQDLTLDHIEGIRKASMLQARRDMGRILFNASDTSNLAHSMRFLSPFFSAWEDTMTKWGQLLYDNPEILARAHGASINKTGMVVDQNGNTVDEHGKIFDRETGALIHPGKDYKSGSQYVLLPKSLTRYIPILGDEQGAGQQKIRKDSINSVFQGSPWWLPGFGPAVQIPVNHFVLEAFPKEVNDPILKFVLPYGTTTDSVQSQLLPKWIKSAQNAFGTTQAYYNQYSIFLTEATVDHTHGGPPVDLDKVANKTRNYFILHAAVDNASPVSFQPDAKYQLYLDKANAYKADPNRKDWRKDFYNDFPGYFELSLGLSANNTGIQATNAAMDATVKYRKDIQANPDLGWLYVGPANQAGAFAPGVYDWQQTHAAGKGLNFRGKKDPVVALEQANSEQGWQQWNSFKTAVNLELEKRGLFATRQKGAEDLAAAVKGYEEELSQTNPDWAKSKASAGGPGKAGVMIQAADDFIGKHPDVKNRPDMVALAQYAQFRYAAKELLATRSNKSLQYNPDIQSALENYGKQLVASNVGFEAMWNRTLEFDDLSDIELPKAA